MPVVINLDGILIYLVLITWYSSGPSYTFGKLKLKAAEIKIMTLLTSTNVQLFAGHIVMR